VGRVTAEIDEEDRRTEFVYDALGRLTSVKDPASHLTQYSYDEVGNRTETRNALGHPTAYQYDRLGRETRRILADGAFESREYDSRGNVVAKTDFRGNRVTFRHDSNDRLLRKDYPTGPPVSITYNADGSRLSVTDARGTTSYQYEPVRGRLLAKSDPTSGWSLEYSWDTAGRTSSIGIRPTGGSSAFRTDYTYDAAGRMHTVTDVDARVYTLSHDPTGNLAQLGRPNGGQHPVDPRHPQSADPDPDLPGLGQRDHRELRLHPVAQRPAHQYRRVGRHPAGVRLRLLVAADHRDDHRRERPDVCEDLRLRRRL
jgi:YD repeat-containing protein